MTVGNTTTGSLVNSLPTVIAAARLVREYEGVMSQLVDRQTLTNNTGLNWNEISLAHLTAQAIDETTVNTNAQQMSDSIFTITPTMVQVQTILTDRVQRRISKNSYQLLGQLAQNSMQRKKDQDLIAVLDGATVSQPGAGATLTSGVIAAMGSQILGNTTEAGKLPLRAVLHPFQIQDFYSELTNGMGTYPTPDGLSAKVFAEGFAGKISQVEVYPDGNISIDSSSDSKGGVFARDGIVLVEGMTLKHETLRLPGTGGGADALFLTDEYAAGERSPGNWVKEIYSDATAPTS